MVNLLLCVAKLKNSCLSPLLHSYVLHWSHADSIVSYFNEYCCHLVHNFFYSISSFEVILKHFYIQVMRKMEQK